MLTLVGAILYYKSDGYYYCWFQMPESRWSEYWRNNPLQIMDWPRSATTRESHCISPSFQWDGFVWRSPGSVNWWWMGDSLQWGKGDYGTVHAYMWSVLACMCTHILCVCLMCVQLLFLGGDVVCSNKTSVCMCVRFYIYIYIYIYIWDKCVFAMTVYLWVQAIRCNS